ncbi:MAG: hypothetical protein ACI4DY_13275 [Monoglobaceae bacterium]
MEKWLNKYVQDTITGYTGIVTAYAVYANDVARLLVEALDTTGRPIECWVEVERAEIIQNNAH